MPANNDLGRAYYCRTEYAQAEAAFREALRLMPRNTTALFNLGRVYCNQTKIEEAQQTLSSLSRERHGTETGGYLLVGTGLAKRAILLASKWEDGAATPSGGNAAPIWKTPSIIPNATH
ncbi:MAG: tetratricopeptide repeat protein [Acidobacteriota bacterium]